MRSYDWPLTQTYELSQVEEHIATRQPERYIFEQVCTVSGVSFCAAGASLPDPDPTHHYGRNEDDILIDRSKDAAGLPEGLPMYAVLDGVGSYQNSEYASVIGHWAVQHVLEWAGTVMEPEEATELMDNALISAHSSVAMFARSNGMLIGSTVIAIRPFMTPKGEWRMAVGHVGDSRGVVFAEDYRSVEQLTVDHAAISAWTEEKQLAFAQALKSSDLSAEQQREFRQRNFIRTSLGKPVPPTQGNFERTVRIYPLPWGKKVVLTTDGIHDPLTYSDMAKILKHSEDDLFANAYTLVKHAQRVYEREQSAGEIFRGKRDDGSAVVFRAVRL